MRRNSISALVFLPLTSQVQAVLGGNAIAKQYFGNDSPWYRDRIPFFETSDKEITDVYYYRWNIFRAHQRDLGANGFISTEFLDDVGWQTNPWASLNDATGFHLLEGRWCRDRRFKEDYATFMLSSNSNTRQFSESMAASIYKGFLVDGVASDAIARLDAMTAVYDAWQDAFDTSKGLYYVEPLRDATEYTISSIDATNGVDGFTGGNSFRPSINAYQYDNARSIAKLAELKGGAADLVSLYSTRADDIKSRVQNELWNSTLEHFMDRFQVDNDYVKYWDFIWGRELVGFVPWVHDLPDDIPGYAEAWKHALDTNEFAASHGLRTVGPTYEYYMRQYRYILQQYAKLHYNPERGNTLDLEEDYYPDTGYLIVGLKRSLHYFHSGFVESVLSGFVGIRPSADDVLEVNPAAEASAIFYFRADSIIYHGREIAVEVDGQEVASSPTLARLSVQLSRTAPSAIARKIAKSIKLSVDTAFPAGSASVSGVDAASLYGAIDGRIWFFSEIEVANGWSTPKGNGTDVWFQVDFGSSIVVSSAEIAFFANPEQGFDVPTSYRIQAANGDSWVDVAESKYANPVANGITEASWFETNSSKARVVFSPKVGQKVRLMEFKVF
ncbi:six-hairpin glycosidase [Lizonia empirigonia]|nr:six-hairpin glycosidase [Lizonia empirigonia]